MTARLWDRRPVARPRKDERESYDLETITDVALEVFRQRGFEGASIVDIAKAAGLTKSSLYHHVSGKEELLSRGLNRALDALFGILGEESARDGSPTERLAHVLGRAVEVEMALLPEVTVLLRARGNTESERQALERRRNFDGQVAAIVAEGQATAEIRDDIDATVLTRLVLGMANWLAEWYRRDGPVAPDQIVAAYRKIVFEGIRA